MSDPSPPDQRLVPAATAAPATLPTPAERERIIALLSDHFAQGTIEVEELERRVGLAQTARSRDEVLALLADLPALTAPAARPEKAMVPASQVESARWSVTIMGGVERRGSWRVPRRLKVVTFMGGALFDFREALMAPGVTELDITAFMGGVEIIVPPELPVEASGFAFMGGFEHVDRVPANPDPNGPVLRIRGFAMMGGVDIQMRLRGESLRDARRRERREHRERRERRRLDAPEE